MGNIIISSVLLPMVVSVLTTLISTKVLDSHDGFFHSGSRKNTRKEIRKSGYIQIFVRDNQFLTDIDTAEIDCCLIFDEMKSNGIVKRIELGELKAAESGEEIKSFKLIEIMNNNKDRSSLKKVVFQDLLGYRFEELEMIDGKKLYKLFVDSMLQPKVIEFSDSNVRSIYRLSSSGEEFVLDEVLDVEIEK